MNSTDRNAIAFPRKVRKAPARAIASSALALALTMSFPTAPAFGIDATATSALQQIQQPTAAANAADYGYDVKLFKSNVQYCVGENGASLVPSFSEGLGRVQDPGTGLYGWVDPQGNLAIPCKHIAVGDNNSLTGTFFDGLAGVYDPETNLWGFIDTAGNQVIPCRLQYPFVFSEGLLSAEAIDFDASTGDIEEYAYVIDRSGNVVCRAPENIFVSGLFSEGLAAVYNRYETEFLQGYMDSTGKLAIPLRYTEARDFANGLAAVTTDPLESADKKFSFIDHTGRTVIPAVVSSEHADAFLLGDFVPYQDATTGLWGYYAKDGSIAMQPQYRAAGVFKDGFACVQLSDGTWAAVDESFQPAFTTDRQLDASAHESNLFKAIDPMTGRCGAFDSHGNVAIPFEYSSLDIISNEGRPLVAATVANTGENVILTADGVRVTAYSGASLSVGMCDDYLWVRTGTAADGVSGLYDIYHVVPRTMPAFSDVDSSAWYMADGWVPYVVENGIMSGYPDGRFGPDDLVTRGQVATILYRHATGATAEDTDNDVSTPFSDVPSGSYCAAAVAWAAEAGVVTGDPNTGTFSPDSPVTREALATMVARYASWCQAESEPGEGFGGLAGSEGVSAWASEGVQWCIANGVISGKGGAIAAGDGATRAEMAKIATVTMRDIIAR